MSAEQIEAVLDAHHLSGGGRNLGRWRTEWTCACGATLITDGHNGPSLRDANNAHLSEQIAALLPEVTETVEWALRRDDGKLSFAMPTGSPDSEYWTRRVAGSRDDTTVVTRVVRTYRAEVSEWREVQQ